MSAKLAKFVPGMTKDDCLSIETPPTYCFSSPDIISFESIRHLFAL